MESREAGWECGFPLAAREHEVRRAAWFMRKDAAACKLIFQGAEVRMILILFHTDEEGFAMLNFDEEIKKFQRSLEVEDAEDTIYNNDVPDISDLISQLMQEADASRNRNSR